MQVIKLLPLLLYLTRVETAFRQQRVYNYKYLCKISLGYLVHTTFNFFRAQGMGLSK